jgi:peptidoglycan/LPS O-acetylase OafA/YrhL
MPSTETASTSPFKYRPDVDGLRALAVLPVLLFHAKLGCTGGFVGVDVFFVISGYVISSLILREVAAGTFSMVNFWERRIRRIMPALSVVVATALAAAWLFYLPEDFQRLGKSAMAQALMAANFYFWKDGNYFDPGAETKPLLHTWSLAVEEQFYLLFPLLLTFLIRSKNRSWQRWIMGITLVSLLISVIGSYSTHNQRAAFYLLPTRAWELLTGALLAMHRGRLTPSKIVGEASGWLGLALICGSIFFYDESTRFPGLAAVPPCLGTALIIASGTARLSVVGRLLSFKPFVFIGLISYPLYLWHWPLLVFGKYLSAFELSSGTRVLLLIASFILAVITWRFVETPFRQRRWLSTRPGIFKFAGIATVVFLAFGLAVNALKGIPARFPARALAYADSRDHHAFREVISPARAFAGEFTELGSVKSGQPINVLLWGDSHAMAVAPVLDRLCREHSQRGVLAAFHSTAPVLKYVSAGPHGLDDLSPKVADSVIAFISQQHVRNVVITARWDSYGASAEFRDDLIATVRAIINAGAHAYVLKDVPTPGFDVPRITALTALRGGELEALGETPEHLRQANAALLPTFEQLAQMGATVLDPTDLFLNSKGIYGVLKNDEVLYYDSHHLTVEGAALLKPLFSPLFQSQ